MLGKSPVGANNVRFHSLGDIKEQYGISHSSDFLLELKVLGTSKEASEINPLYAVLKKLADI